MPQFLGREQKVALLSETTGGDLNSSGMCWCLARTLELLALQLQQKYSTELQ